MKPARKTRDFSIESILADGRVRNERRFGARNCDAANKRFDECSASSEAENCEVVAGEKYGELPNDNLDVERENENKLHSVTHKISIRKCTESDFKIEEDGKCDGNILEFEQETKSNARAEIIGYGDKCTISSKKRGEFDVACEEKHEDYCKTIKRDQNEKRKKQDQFYDSGVKYLDKNRGDFTENRCEGLGHNFDCQELTESKYSSFKNEESEFSRSKTGTSEVLRDIAKLEWLHCTRYKPPKIPRKPTIGKSKRKPSFYPRIPFSMFQLDFLEQKFQNSAYLTRNDVMDISDVLKLPPNRIKIWFQNRRARERREFCTDV